MTDETIAATVGASDPAPIDAKAAFQALSLDAQASALFDHLSALAVAVDGVASDIAAIKAAPPAVAAIPPEFDAVVVGLARLTRHVFGA